MPVVRLRRLERALRKVERKDLPRVVKQARDRIAMEVLSGVVLMTPVDTGRARANWLTGEGVPVTIPTESVDKAGGSTISDGEAVISGAAPFSKIWLTNNLPYIGVLEHGGYPGDGPKTSGGYSIQAPQGMVAVTIARVTANLK